MSTYAKPIGAYNIPPQYALGKEAIKAASDAYAKGVNPQFVPAGYDYYDKNAGFKANADREALMEDKTADATFARELERQGWKKGKLEGLLSSGGMEALTYEATRDENKAKSGADQTAAFLKAQGYRADEVANIMQYQAPLAQAAAYIGMEDVKNISKPNLDMFADGYGIEIGPICKFGKSKNLYKSVKIPKILLGSFRMKRPTPPGMIFLRFVTFIWRIMNTGVTHPPKAFVRVGLAFMKDMAGYVPGTTLTKDMVTQSLTKINELAPGIVPAYYAYLQNSALLKANLAATREQKAKARYEAKQVLDAQLSSTEAGATAFANALASMSQVLLGGFIAQPITAGMLGGILSGYADANTKPYAIKPGVKYARI